jgi:hypothetical protein
MILLTIEDVKIFISENSVVYNQLSTLFDRCIAEKKPLFSPDEIDGLAELVNFGLLKETAGERYEFNYDSLVVCYLVMEKAEVVMKSSMPNEIVTALQYADSFYLEIRQPTPRTTWYFHLAMEFDRFILIYLNQLHGIDVTAFYDTITKEMSDLYIPLRHYGNSYASAFPFITDDISKSFASLQRIAISEGKKSYFGTALSDIVKFNPIKARLLYEHGKKSHGEDLPRFFSILQSGLYLTEPTYFFEEASNLLITQPNEGLLAFSWFSYENIIDIDNAIGLISLKVIPDDEYLMNLPAFYCRLIENQYTRPETRILCFQKITELLSFDNESLHYNIVHRVGLIDGYDDLKYSLLPIIINLDPHFMKDFFTRFQDVRYLFDLVSTTYIELGPAVDFNLFSDSFRDLQHNNPKDFETNLLQLLVDDLARARLAGLMVLRSNYSGIYEVDFLKLDEKGQIRIIETLLPHPHSIEDLMPQVIKLRRSEFESVRNLLKSQLIELIWAYDHHLLKLITPLLDDGKAEDEILLNELNAAFKEYDSVKQQKLAVLEFDPLENQLKDYEYYYRTEHEVRAEQMEKATKRSFMTQLAKNIGVIRGNAFKVSGSNKITLLGTVSTSMLIDMRYYHNPDQYQWEYNQEMTGHDYLPEETAE